MMISVNILIRIRRFLLFDLIANGFLGGHFGGNGFGLVFGLTINVYV
jgi:hypothetical protein